MRDTMKHRAAVVAEGWRQVSENLPFVWGAHRLGTRNRGPEKPDAKNLWLSVPRHQKYDTSNNSGIVGIGKYTKHLKRIFTQKNHMVIQSQNRGMQNSISET
ncbi:hypothetical protein M0804_013230 [Polistes exclamans]|nr:hypothetical protein M0804_013230 [Polistes exclamans]